MVHNYRTILKMIKIKIIIVGIVNLFLVNISNAENFFDTFIFQNEIILQENEEAIISFISDIDIDSKGNFWIIDWDSHILAQFDKYGKFLKLIARKGNGPGELMMPQNIYIDNRDHIFIASFTNRISEFDDQGNFIRSFICTDGHFPTSCIAVMSNGNILIGGRKYSSQKKSNIDKENNICGTMIHVYSYEGKYIKSFYEMDPLVRKRNLDMYNACYFAIDDQDKIYASQPVNYVISVFNEKMEPLKTFGSKQWYYKEPKTLTNDIKRNKNKLEEYEQNFTYMGELFIYNKLLIAVAKIFGGINNDQIKYFLDFYNKDTGAIIKSGIQTEKRLVRIRHDNFYFLTIKENINAGEIKNAIEIYKINEVNYK